MIENSVALDRFELLELRRDDGVQTFHAREISTARPVQVHLFANGSVQDHLALLSRIDHLPDSERRRVIDRGVSEGKPYLVTDRLAGFASLREWLDANSAAPTSVDQQFYALFDSPTPQFHLRPERPEPDDDAHFTAKPLGAMALGIAAALVFLAVVIALIAFRPR